MSVSFFNVYYVYIQYLLMFIAMECQDTPDLGSSANVISYSWNSQTIVQTEITLSCEFGEYSIRYTSNDYFLYFILNCFRKSI